MKTVNVLIVIVFSLFLLGCGFYEFAPQPRDNPMDPSAEPDGDAGEAPAAPLGVTIAVGDAEVTVSWDPVDGADSYNVYWDTEAGVDTADTKIEGASSPYVHADLTYGTMYYYVVTAVSAGGESTLSSEVSATPQAPTAPGAPSGVSAAAGTREVTITWEETAGADSYTIYWNTSGGITTSDSEITEVTSPHTDTGLTNGLTRYYVVTASNAGGESPVSTEVNAMPTFTAQHLMKLVPSDAQASDEFGTSVSISGDYAIVGAERESADAGAAYISHRTGADTWDEGVKLVASDAQANDWFGCSVSIDGDYAIVGADREDSRGTDAGAAYIFHRTGADTWDGGVKFVSLNPETYGYFGSSVSIDGDYAIVGANGEGDPLSRAGAAYIFHRTGTNTWDGGVGVVAPDAQAYDYFGRSVSIDGDYAIVGACEEDGGAGDPLTDAGAAYLY